MNEFASGYIGMGNNPANLIDPMGMQTRITGGGPVNSVPNTNIAYTGGLTDNSPEVGYLLAFPGSGYGQSPTNNSFEDYRAFEDRVARQDIAEKNKIAYRFMSGQFTTGTWKLGDAAYGAPGYIGKDGMWNDRESIFSNKFVADDKGSEIPSKISNYYFYGTLMPSMAASIVNDTKYGQWASMGGQSLQQQLLARKRA